MRMANVTERKNAMLFASYDGMNMDVIEEGSIYSSKLSNESAWFTNAKSAMLVTSVVRHTLERVWSPDVCIYVCVNVCMYV